MAVPTASGDRDYGALMVLVLGLGSALVAGQLQRTQTALDARMNVWAAARVTVAGVQAQRVRSGISPASPGAIWARTALAAGIRIADAARPHVAAFLLLSLLLGAYPWAVRSLGPPLHWRREVLLAAMALTGIAGAGSALAIPACWPGWAQLIGALLALPNLAAALAFGALACIAPRAGKQVLQHGPPFRSPAREGSAIRVGSPDSSILPGHARWLAGAAGPIEIPFSRLSCGLTILGEKGSGKSRLLFAIHDAIRAAHPAVPILIHDPKGEWYRTYYDAATDLYFAPHFKGSAAWGLWEDFRRAPELRHELIASTVNAHPDPNGSFWMDQAVDLLEAALDGDSFGNSARFLANFPKDHADDKFALSVFGTARLGFMDLAKVELMGSALAGGAAQARSIDSFLNWPGRILLLNDPSCASQQHGAFSLFLSAFLLRALSMPDVPAGTLRVVAIIDEALTFSLPADIDRRIYALCRSKGICIIAGAQRLPSARNHERGEWETAEYTFAMKVMNQDTQKALSQRAGSLLFRERTTSTSTSRGGDSRTESQHDVRTDTVPPEHFGRLAPREFLLFHDRGLVTGRTVDVHRPQRSVAFPVFDARDDVRQISLQLLGG